MRKLIVAAIVGGAVSAAVADRSFDLSVQAFSEGVLDRGGVAGPGLYSTGFEAPFVPGPLEPQQGWTASHVNDPWASISTLNPNGGTQHLRTVRQGTAAGGGQRVALSPALGAQPLGSSAMSIDVFIDATGGADYDVVPQAPTQGFLTARVKFRFNDIDGDTIPGDIMVLDDLDGPGPGGLAFVTTGVEYTPGAYKNLRIEVDPGTGAVGQGAVRYYYDGALIYTNAFGLIAGSAMEQAVVLHDNFQADALQHGDFDNLAITPEPASLLALGLGGLVALRRRR